MIYSIKHPIGDEIDFVSHTFYPQKSIFEDPATGASHSLLVPNWSKQLNKTKLSGRQISERGGKMICQNQGNRVLVNGKAVLYMQGIITI